MTKKMKDQTTNEIRELTQDEIASVSGGNMTKAYVPAPDDAPGGGSEPPLQGHSQTIITFGGQRIGGTAH